MSAYWSWTILKHPRLHGEEEIGKTFPPPPTNCTPLSCAANWFEPLYLDLNATSVKPHPSAQTTLFPHFCGINQTSLIIVKLSWLLLLAKRWHHEPGRNLTWQLDRLQHPLLDVQFSQSNGLTWQTEPKHGRQWICRLRNSEVPARLQSKASTRLTFSFPFQILKWDAQKQQCGYRNSLVTLELQYSPLNFPCLCTLTLLKQE